MTRGVGVTSGLQDLLPTWSAPIIALLTTLGDAVVLGTVLVVAFLFRKTDREDIVVVGLLFVAGSGLYEGLKAFFAASRPEQRLRPGEGVPDVVISGYDILVSTGGFGFPSGHATGATIVYLGLAFAISAGTRRKRLGLAGVVIAIVATSRLALGAHYLVDVIAGFLLGTTLVLGGFALCDRLPIANVSTAFGIAIAGTIFFVVMAAGQPKAVALCAGTLVAAAVWYRLRTRVRWYGTA